MLQIHQIREQATRQYISQDKRAPFASGDYDKFDKCDKCGHFTKFVSKQQGYTKNNTRQYPLQVGNVANEVTSANSSAVLNYYLATRH